MLNGNPDVAPTGLSKYFLDRSYPRLARHGPHDVARFAGSGMSLCLILTPMGVRGQFLKVTVSHPRIKKGETMFKDFKEFVMRGNVLDMAVGIVIGASF